MKEILRYLRQTNSLTQEEVARRLEISRQSYIKYENGEVVPGDKVVRELSIIYGVREEFIRRNQVPKPDCHDGECRAECRIDENAGLASVESPSASQASTASYGENFLPDGRRILEGIFDGSVVRLLGSLEGLNLKKGQKFRLYVENEEEEKRKKKEAFKNIMKFKGTLPADFDCEKARYEALEEKYGPFN